MKDIPIHPLADIFPVLSGNEMTRLRDDIKAKGLRQPIVLYEGKILDGKHRYEVCSMLGIEARFTEYEGDDPEGFVISLNLERRHLDVGQRAMIAQKLSVLERGKPPKNVNSLIPPIKTQKANADRVNVSVDSVKKAKSIASKSPSVAKQVANGEISLNAAAKKVDAAKARTEIRKDAIGRVIPDDMIENWDRALEVAKRLRSCASEIKTTVEKGLAEKDVIFAEITNPTIGEAAGLHYTLSQIAPHSICPACQGKLRNNCQLCRRRGWISRFLYNSPAVSAETRTLLEKVAAKGKPC